MARKPQRRFRTERVDRDAFRLDAPFARWFASHHARGQGESSTRTSPTGVPTADFIMGELASRRFSIGVDDDRVPALGVAEDDADAIMSLPWNGAAFLRRVQSKDWVALSCADARVDGAKLSVPIQVRLWLPATSGLLDIWLDEEGRPTTLKLVEAAIMRGRPIPKGGNPLATLSLDFKGRWAEA